MAKKGFTINNVQNFLAPSADKAGWTLCIGAGTSLPIFPDWYSLSEQLAHNLVPDLPIDITSMKNAGFSPDSLIQMVKNACALNDHEFAMRMSEVLYANLKSSIDTNDWDTVSKIMQTDHLSHAPVQEWKTFIAYRDSVLSNTTAHAIAPVILKAIEHDVAPKSIITFNAEPILLIILNSLILEKYSDADHPYPKKIFCKMTNGISNQGNKQIPFFFCHGLLPINEKAHTFSTSLGKLVFLEEEYLQLANNSFSWQATTFLNACTTQHIVFIGTSLTDPNMRRWLSWVHTNRLNEMRQNGIDVECSTQHYWIRTIPKDRDTIPWIEAIVAHLGIRIIWIDDWSQCPLALEKILGIAPRPLIKPKTTTPKAKHTSKYKSKNAYNSKNKPRKHQ